MEKAKKNTFNDIFANLSQEEANKTALECGEESFTYAQLNMAIDLCAADLIELGVKPGDHVGVWTFNSANALIAFFAIIRAGALAVLCNYSLTYEEISDQLTLTDVKFLLYGNNLASRNDKDLPSKLCEALKIKGMDIRPQSCTYMGKKIDISHMDELEHLAELDVPNRDAFIIFTTGSTSKPKAVIDHQEGLMLNSYRYIEYRGPLMGDCVCVSLPLFHIFGLHMILSYFLNRAKVCLTDKVGADGVINTVINKGCTDIVTVTSVHLNVLEHSDFNKITSQVRLLTTAGGVLTPVQFMKMEMAYQNAKLFNEYGQSEAHGSIFMCRWDDPIEKRAFTVGKPFASDEIAIRGINNEATSAKIAGEIEVKNHSVMNGYYKLPLENQAIDEEGWLHTGDLGAFDEEGYVHLVGRAKDMIIKNGVNIAPVEVEQAVSEIAGVREVKVYGLKHWIFGESVECCVCMDEGAEFDESAFKAELKGKLAHEKIPDHIFYFKEFPITPSGKLDARRLRIELVNIIRHLYVEEKVDKGFECFNLHIRSAEYSIVPAAAMLKAFAESIFPNKAEKICLAVEEFLRIRIIENANDVGDIQIKCAFFKDWLTIEFSDQGENYYIEKNVQTSLCAKLILAVVDNFIMDIQPSKPTRYRMQFKYPDEFDIKEFLVTREREEL